jgi:hypothetical protein
MLITTSLNKGNKESSSSIATPAMLMAMLQPSPKGFELQPLKLQNHTLTTELTPHDMLVGSLPSRAWKDLSDPNNFSAIG